MATANQFVPSASPVDPSHPSLPVQIEKPNKGRKDNSVPQLLTRTQAAAILGIGTIRTFEGLVARGELPVIVVGRRNKFRMADLQKWIAIQERPAMRAPSPTLARGFNSQSLLQTYFTHVFAPVMLGTHTRRSIRAKYRAAIDLFVLFLGRPAVLADLKHETVKAFLNWLAESDSAAYTVNDPRGCLIAIWRHAASKNLIAEGPDPATLPRGIGLNAVPAGTSATSGPAIEKISASQYLKSDTLLTGYVDAIYIPAKLQCGASASALHQTTLAIRWFDAFSKKAPTLADLSVLTSQPSMAAQMIRFVVAHGRKPATARLTVERLFALWRHVLFAGHMPTNGQAPRLPGAIRHVNGRKSDVKAARRIPTTEEAKRTAIKRSPLAPKAIATTATPETLLREFLFNYYAMERPLGAGTLAASYASSIRWFERFLQRPAKLADLARPQLNALITSAEGTLSPRTVLSYRRSLLSFWRFAFETEVLAELPRRIRKVKCPRLAVEGWDREEVGKLLAAADKVGGSFRKSRRSPTVWNAIQKRAWWRAFILTAWYTGLRVGDVLEIKYSSIAVMEDGSGRLTVVMNKTGDAIHRVLPAEAMEAVKVCMASEPSRELCFPLWAGRRYFHREAHLLIKLAGLRGSLKWLRRGGASEAERLRAGAGRQHLGHRTAGLFESNYRVDRITQQDITLPPAPAFQPTLRLEHKTCPAAGAKGGAE